VVSGEYRIPSSLHLRIHLGVNSRRDVLGPFPSATLVAGAMPAAHMVRYPIERWVSIRVGVSRTRLIFNRMYCAT